MKVQLFLLVILSMVISSTFAQCRPPIHPVCTGNKDEGVSIGVHCWPTTTWWYNSRERRCLSMTYRGCGGNHNRYCSLADCQRRCQGVSG